MSAGGGMSASSGVSDSTSQRVANELANNVGTGDKNISLAGRDTGAMSGSDNTLMYVVAGVAVVGLGVYYMSNKK